MNHKRKRPKHQRAGCLQCKPHKDERVAKPSDAEPRPPGVRRKNRRKWCRGVVGVEHRPRWVDERPSKDVLVYKCERCGKELDSIGPWRWSTKWREKYERVLAENGFPRAYRSTRFGRMRE